MKSLEVPPPDWSPVELRKVPPEELLREAMRQAFPNVDMTDPSLIETPKRVLKFWREFSHAGDVDQYLSRSFSNERGSQGMVVQAGIPFRALCEHHLLPFFGVAHVGYLPNQRVIGLSKLARIVRSIGTRRPTVQETVTEEIAKLLYKPLDSRGSIVVIKAEHTCMSIRGVAAPNVVTTTSAIKGLFRDAEQVRDEFFRLVEMQS